MNSTIVTSIYKVLLCEIVNEAGIKRKFDEFTLYRLLTYHGLYILCYFAVISGNHGRELSKFVIKICSVNCTAEINLKENLLNEQDVAENTCLEKRDLFGK